MASGGVKGGREAAALLRAMSGALPERRMMQVRQNALRPMQREAQDNFRANGSYVSGVIPKDIVIAETGQAQTSLGMTGMGAKLGHMIEWGTAPHEQPNRGTYHPGSEPKPFMRPAFEAMRDQTIRSVRDDIESTLVRIAALNRR